MSTINDVSVVVSLPFNMSNYQKSLVDLLYSKLSRLNFRVVIFCQFYTGTVKPDLANVYPLFRYFAVPKPLAVNANNRGFLTNVGMKYCDTKYVLLLDYDCHFNFETIKEMVLGDQFDVIKPFRSLFLLNAHQSEKYIADNRIATNSRDFEIRAEFGLGSLLMAKRIYTNFSSCELMSLQNGTADAVANGHLAKKNSDKVTVFPQDGFKLWSGSFLPASTSKERQRVQKVPNRYSKQALFIDSCDYSDPLQHENSERSMEVLKQRNYHVRRLEYNSTEKKFDIKFIMEYAYNHARRTDELIVFTAPYSHLLSDFDKPDSPNSELKEVFCRLLSSTEVINNEFSDEFIDGFIMSVGTYIRYRDMIPHNLFLGQIPWNYLKFLFNFSSFNETKFGCRVTIPELKQQIVS
jgi:hypothetical protein